MKLCGISDLNLRPGMPIRWRVKNIVLSVIFIGYAVPSLAGDSSLPVSVVPTRAVKTPDFVQGAALGPGVVEKELEESEIKVSQKGPQKTSPKRNVASVQKAQTSARSIASFPEDTKYSNDFIERVRAKDSSDRKETLAIVRAAIERGEFGEAAKKNLENQK